MVDMNAHQRIFIWPGCDQRVADAIKEYLHRWGPYSKRSRSKPISSLIQEVIDPAVISYMSELPREYLDYFPSGSTTTPLSELIQKIGFTNTARAQRLLLRKFLDKVETQSLIDKCFIGTIETLQDLCLASDLKRPKKLKVRDTRLNGRRVNEYCRFCGSTAELTAFASGSDAVEPVGDEKLLRLSSSFCAKHRPLQPDGQWNASYKKAKRSTAHFDQELIRLCRQAADQTQVLAQSNDSLVDTYIYHLIKKNSLDRGDESKLRHLARRMADAKLTDRKKLIALLYKFGAAQPQIAELLGISRQAVFKALTSIPEEFRALPSLKDSPCFIKFD